MPECSCQEGLIMSVLAVVLLLPAQYYMPKSFTEPPPPPETPALPADHAWLTTQILHIPTLDTIFAVLLVLVVSYMYISEWIHIKLIERQMVKLNRQLRASVARLREWDERQEQLERDLKTAQSATAEYNLMFYLLQRRARARAQGDKLQQRC